jgi:universal stress protein A
MAGMNRKMKCCSIATVKNRLLGSNSVEPDLLRSNGNKKRTQFHKRGAASFQERAQDAGMKTQERPTRPGSSAIDIKRILVPVDFSDLSSNAVKSARHIGELMKAELIFINVIEHDGPLALETVPPACIEELKANAEENLRVLVRAARESGIKRATSISRSGMPAHEIVEAAKESDVDLIVIATHGYSGWKHFCIGSTAERVVRAAPCSVLVVREKEHDFI